LSLIEDAVVIYRLARAPSRLVFNVDVGAMPPPKAEAYLKRLMQQYWSSKTFDVDQNSTVKKFNPQSILDNFWFAKRTGSDGTSVQQLEGANAAWGMEEMLYFVKKLYKSLKVPATRLNPDDAYTPDMNILREELKFAKFIVRVQQHFAEGLKNGFITHLKLRKLWEKYEIK
jgi:gamma-glutamyl:cysteine ligase YbdK (ATP-grasp superfamily)